MRELILRRLLLSALIVAGCRVEVPNGIFRCDDDRGCPEGWSCRADGLCYPTADPYNTPITDYPDAGSDATVPPDPRPDAALDATLPPPSDASEPDDAEPPLPPLDAGDGATPPEPPGEPEVDGPCEVSGEKACRGHASFDKLVCRDGRWLIIGVCDGDYRCNTKPGPALGSCQPIAPLCLDKAPGDAICDGLVRKRCNADLLGYEPNDCPADAHCEVDPLAAVSCACDSGYRDDGEGNCVNIDDCPEGACAPGACVDGLNSYSCECPSGFTSDGTSCANIDDCPSPNPCTPGSCIDGVNTFSCECPAGFSSTGSTCSNIDDCPSPDPCGEGQCVDGVQKFTCNCKPGYRDAGGVCVDPDDCPSGACAPGQCHDGLDTYSCECPEYYQSTGKACENINDCPTGACEPYGCIDGMGTYSCDCPNDQCLYDQGGFCAYLCGGGEFPQPFF